MVGQPASKDQLRLSLRLDPWGGEGEVDLGYQYVDCGPEWNRRMNELCSLSLDYAGG